MSRNFGKDLTSGSIPRHLLTFSIPMLLGNLLQTGYGIVNTIWVGNKVGPDAVGATQVSFPIVFILIALASGATLATTILVSQYYGAKDHVMVEKVVNNSFGVSLIVGAILTAAGILSGDALLRAMGTPPEIFKMASSYLKITVAGFIIMFFVFLITSILRGIGDTKTPLVFMAIGITINAVLDPFMIIGIWPFPRLGLDGPAYASLIAQGIALFLALIYLRRKNHFVAINPRKITLDRHLTVQLLKIGFPSMIQQSLVSVGAAFISGFVNSFGAVATDAFGAAARIENIVFMPAMSFGMAVSALTGQNLGAGKQERVREIFKWGVIMTSIVTLTLSACIVAFPRLMLSIFVQDPGVLDIGSGYLRIVGSCYILFAIIFISNGIINGSGHTVMTMVLSLVTLWVIRVPLAAILTKTSLGINGIWTAMDSGFAIGMVISLIYYFSGIWKKPVIKRSGNIQNMEPDTREDVSRAVPGAEADISVEPAP